MSSLNAVAAIAGGGGGGGAGTVNNPLASAGGSSDAAAVRTKAALRRSMSAEKSSSGSGSGGGGGPSAANGAARSVSSLSYESRSSTRTSTGKAYRASDAESGMIHPRNENKIWWDGYILVLVLYSVTVELYTTTMGTGLQDEMDLIDWFVDISYWMDILLNFRTGYDEDGRGYRYVMNSRKSGARYLKGWFLIDFVSTFPYALFDATKDHLISLLRLLRVTRLVRVLGAGGNARELFPRDYRGILLSIHFLGCLFHLLGQLELHEQMPGGVTSQFPGKASNWLLQYNLVSIEDGGMPGWDRDTSQPKEPRPGSVGSEGASVAERSNGPNDYPFGMYDEDGRVSMRTKYLYSVYFAITTVTTIGFGDVTPVTNAEIAFVCVAELLGMFMFVYTTNSVSALLRGLDAKRTAFQEHLDRIQEYMEARGTPSELQKRVVQYLTFINSPKCLTEAKEDELLAPLTSTLREEMRMASYVPWLTRNLVIRDLLEITGGQFSSESGTGLVGGGEYITGSELEGFVHKLSLQLHSVSTAPFDLIINAADGPSVNLTVYFLLTGKVQLYGNDHGSEGEGTAIQVIRTIGPNDPLSLFGAHELFHGVEAPPAWCIEAAEFCDLAYISREAFKEAIHEEEEMHVRFHLERMFAWAKEPEPEQEVVDEGAGGVEFARDSFSNGNGNGNGMQGQGGNGGRGNSNGNAQQSFGSVAAGEGSPARTRTLSDYSPSRTTQQQQQTAGNTAAAVEPLDDLCSPGRSDSPGSPESLSPRATAAANGDHNNGALPSPSPSSTAAGRASIGSAEGTEGEDRQPIGGGGGGGGSGGGGRRARREAVTQDRRLPVSTGRRMARRKSITAVMHHQPGPVGALSGADAAAAAVAAHGMGLDLTQMGGGGSGGNSPAGSIMQAPMSDGDGMGVYNGGGDSVRSMISDNSGGPLHTVNSGEHANYDLSPGGAWPSPAPHHRDSSPGTGGNNGSSGRGRNDTERTASGEVDDSREWRHTMMKKVASQSMTIGMMQTQIGMLCEMMGDANSKMDSLLQLQQGMAAQQQQQLDASSAGGGGGMMKMGGGASARHVFAGAGAGGVVANEPSDEEDDDDEGAITIGSGGSGSGDGGTETEQEREAHKARERENDQAIEEGAEGEEEDDEADQHHQLHGEDDL